MVSLRSIYYYNSSFASLVRKNFISLGVLNLKLDANRAVRVIFRKAICR
jgi:hypothetical protein